MLFITPGQKPETYDEDRWFHYTFEFSFTIYYQKAQQTWLEDWKIRYLQEISVSSSPTPPILTSIATIYTTSIMHGWVCLSTCISLRKVRKVENLYSPLLLCWDKTKRGDLVISSSLPMTRIASLIKAIITHHFPLVDTLHAASFLQPLVFDQLDFSRLSENHSDFSHWHL